MKLFEAPTKIVGIQVGELTVDLIRGGAVKTRYALLTDDGPISFMDLAGNDHWSPKTVEAMRAFIEALEEDGARLVFKLPAQGTETSQVEGSNEPAQF